MYTDDEAHMTENGGSGTESSLGKRPPGTPGDKGDNPKRKRVGTACGEWKGRKVTSRLLSSDH